MSRPQVVIFAGTTEGRKLGEALAQAGIPVLLCVATGYGEELVKPHPLVQVRCGRMEQTEMESFLREESCRWVVDATHPYAKVVTVNLAAACAAVGASCLRLVREQVQEEDVVAVSSMEEAAAVLAQDGGKALLTVGSKELEPFTVIPDYQQRLAVRVLPMPEALEKCGLLGFRGKQIIGMQGPFSHEINVAMLRDWGADWLVTKDSGETGGLYEKLSAARTAGAKVLLIRRPEEQEQGHSYQQVLDLLLQKLGNEPIQKESFPRFPLFVDLRWKTVVVVGGGTVGVRRVETLLRCGAEVTVIAPQVAPMLPELAGPDREARLHWHKRAYRYGDLNGALLAVAATDDREVNRQVAEEAKTLGIAYSVADDPQAGSFWFPALVQKDNLAIGLVSTDGDHKAVRNMADRLRNNREEQ